MVFDLRMSLEIKDTDARVKSDRELENDRAGGTIQASSFEGVADEATCKLMVLIFVAKKFRKAVQFSVEILEGRVLGGCNRWLTVEKRALVLPFPAEMMFA